MADEPEVILHQMEETRTSLKEKLETLEGKVMSTVHEATSAVTDTVTNVKEAFEGTVSSVKHSVEDTVSSVKDTFNLEHQVAQHPWAMLLGSAFVGYLGGCLLTPPSRGGSYRTHSADPSVSRNDWSGPSHHPHSADASFTSQGVQGLQASSAGETPEKSWLGDLATTYSSEINKLKGLTIGTVMGVVRDMVASSVPPPLVGQLTQLVDDVTTKLGGEPIRGSIFNTQGSAHASHGEHSGTRGY